MKVQCDDCEKKFEVVNQVRKHPNDIEEKYFQCTHCGREYTFLVTDPALRREQSQLKLLHDEYIRRKNAAQVRAVELSSQINTDKFIDDVIQSLDELE